MHENFFHKIKVYYEDTDAGGVVYYANYLKFLERARTEALYSIGFSNSKIKPESVVNSHWSRDPFRFNTLLNFSVQSQNLPNM